jgi:molybdopterin converting factor small subunit
MNADTKQEPPPTIRILFSYWGLAAGEGAQDRAMEVPPATTLDGLLGLMGFTLGRDLRAETASNGTRFITVNGIYRTMPGGGPTALADGDDVSVLPFVAGG